MSFQPQLPTVGPMASQPPPVAVQPAKGKRRKGLIMLGLALLLGGLVAAAVMLLKSASNYESEVKSMARAPVGCTTTLEFDNPSTFNVYIETKGKLAELSGNCDANGTAYARSDENLPKVSLTLVDTGDEPVELRREGSASYDVAGFVGAQVRTVRIEQAGTYRLDVESPDSDFAVAIGKDPQADRDTLNTIGYAVGAVGVVLGLTCLLLGLRRRRPTPGIVDVRNPVGPLPGWPPGPYAGGPPTAPPIYSGYRPESPPPAQPVGSPTQAPIRIPEQPAKSPFAPPALQPPSMPMSVPGVMPPIPPVAPVAPSPPALGNAEQTDDDGGWAKPDD